MLIDSPPQVVRLPVDPQEDFVEMPFVAGSWASATQLIGVGLPKLEAPLSDRFVGENHAPFGQYLFDVPIAEREPKVEPDAVADDLGGEAMALVERREGGVVIPSASHRLPKPARAHQPDNTGLVAPPYQINFVAAQFSSES